VIVQSERGCLCIARGESQLVFDEFDLHNIASSQTHRDKVLKLLVTRVVEQHPTYFLHLRTRSLLRIPQIWIYPNAPEMLKLQWGHLAREKVVGQISIGKNMKR
jgi:hypothetical protein